MPALNTLKVPFGIPADMFIALITLSVLLYLLYKDFLKGDSLATKAKKKNGSILEYMLN
jgi:hypothetical protein